MPVKYKDILKIIFGLGSNRGIIVRGVYMEEGQSSW